MAKLLIRRGAKVNVRDTYGNTPLHYCGIVPKTYSVAKILLQSGADPNIKNVRGKTPLDLARENRNYSVARLIVRYMKKRKKNK